MEIEEINEPTRNWTVDEFADFLHYRLQHGDRESIRSWWRSTSLLRKLEATGLAGLDGDEVALTPAGIELRDALYLLEDSPDIADANLNLRRHRLLDWHDHALDSEALLRLASAQPQLFIFDCGQCATSTLRLFSVFTSSGEEKTQCAITARVCGPSKPARS